MILLMPLIRILILILGVIIIPLILVAVILVGGEKAEDLGEWYCNAYEKYIR